MIYFKLKFTNKILVVLIIIFLSKHPSTICLSLVFFCVIISFYLKSTVSNIQIYFSLIIFVGGILLLLFYLTIIRTNKPSWYLNFFIIAIILPEFFLYKNLKYRSLSIYIETFHFKNILILVLIIIFFMLLILYVVLNKIRFIRQLNF